MYYSVVLPTYGRPGDVEEFLDSLTRQEYNDFEILVVDATADDSVRQVAEKYLDKLKLNFIYKKGLGISESRNLGVKLSKGGFVVFIDSDCVVPPSYFTEIEKYLSLNKVDAFGGPDAASKDFTHSQKAINYVMTSFLTTGGIRGKAKRIGRFEPRSFNMGVSRKAFDAVGGYSGMKVAEDIDLSMRLHQAGFKTALIPDAYVYHKRKANLHKFLVQMFMYGKARIDLFMRHREALKITYLMPLFFLIYLLAGLASAFFSKVLFILFLASLIFYALAVFIDSSIQNRSLAAGILSVFAAYGFLVCYGSGLIYNIFRRIVLGKKEIERAKILKE
ncbi:MAG TPA: glycosyltransferase [Bacteroidales bacterium]|nr:glycosyltransferase [Bacteroidales bacterium]